MRNASDHYQGVKGDAYFTWQQGIGVAGGRIEARKFAASISPTYVVLDFGCGSASMLLSLDCAQRIGVDASPSARRAAAAEGVDVHESLSEIESASVDVVVSNHALEHTLDPYATCCDLLRVLRPGGRLVLCLPLDSLPRGRSYDPGDRHHHLFTWTPQLLGNLLSEAGFERIACHPLSHAWPPGWRWLDQCLSVPAFDAACRAWSVVARMRQVMAFAVKPTSQVPRCGRVP